MSKPHKNKNRAPLHPLNFETLTLTTLGLGFLRPAPGTWGSLPPVIALQLAILFSLSQQAQTALLITLLLASSVACLAYGRYAEQRFALPNGSPQKDAPEVVSDETAAQALTLLPIPLLAPQDTSTTTLLALCTFGFFAFRAADIIKPPPARALEQLPAGPGVLIDDLVAALYAAGPVALATLLLA